MTESPAAPPERELVTGNAEFTARLAALVAGARRSVVIFSQALDRRVYAAPTVVDAVQAFVLQHQRARLRVVVCAPTMSGGNKLVELGRKVPSRIAFREPPEERKAVLLGEYAVADEQRLLHKDGLGELDGYLLHGAAARERLREFDALWEECLPAREYQVLGI